MPTNSLPLAVPDAFGKSPRLCKFSLGTLFGGETYIFGVLILVCLAYGFALTKSGFSSTVN